MKNLTTCITLLIGVSILFFSCSHESTSLTKRHYRNGYYVEHAKRPTLKPAKYEPAYLDQTHLSPQTADPKIDQGITANVGNINEAEQSDIIHNRSIIIKRVEPKPVIEITLSNSLTTDLKINTFKKVSKSKFPVKKILQSAEDARSYFWWIIALLVAIYIIALLAGGWGLGGLVHILIILAAVLFVLWLLRII